jgi:preprotein translocase subunit Sec61beta
MALKTLALGVCFAVGIVGWTVLFTAPLGLDSLSMRVVVGVCTLVGYLLIES